MPRRDSKKFPKKGEFVWFRWIRKTKDGWLLQIRGAKAIVPDDVATYFLRFRTGPVLLRHNLDWK